MPIAGALCIAAVLSIAYIVLMSNHTKTLAYISIVGLEIINIAMIGLGLWFLTKGPEFLGFAIFNFVFFGFFFMYLNCVLYFYWAKVQIAIAVIGVAADYYAHTKRLIFVSVFYFVIHVAFFAMLVYGVLGIYSTNTFRFTDNFTTG